VYSEEIKATMAAVIRFSGKTDRSGALIKEKEKTLLDWVKKREYKITSKSKYLFYNDPSTPGFLRKNEVMVIIAD
jgi:hypothetical protein